MASRTWCSHPARASTPLALRRARGDSRIRLHVRMDERSASFLALGLARRSERPVAVLCTSGTAAANFHPAVIEADESGVPLLVLTADRPAELRDTGASQTIDQIKLYGAAVRWFSEVGVPEARPGPVAYWRSLACRACPALAGPCASGAGPPERALPRAADPGRRHSWCESLEGDAAGPWTRARVASPPVALHLS